jgi:Leucine-rich repeat (LRR) protein
VEAQRHRHHQQQVTLILCSLSDDAIKALINYPTLNQIMASNNKISNVDSLKTFANLKELSEIDLEGNPVASSTGYREALFSAVEGL